MNLWDEEFYTCTGWFAYCNLSDQFVSSFAHLQITGSHTFLLATSLFFMLMHSSQFFHSRVTACIYSWDLPLICTGPLTCKDLPTQYLYHCNQNSSRSGQTNRWQIVASKPALTNPKFPPFVSFHVTSWHKEWFIHRTSFYGFRPVVTIPCLFKDREINFNHSYIPPANKFWSLSKLQLTKQSILSTR